MRTDPVFSFQSYALFERQRIPTADASTVRRVEPGAAAAAPGEPPQTLPLHTPSRQTGNTAQQSAGQQSQRWQQALEAHLNTVISVQQVQPSDYSREGEQSSGRRGHLIDTRV